MSMTLDEIESRAKRHLDGMTVNRDAMARDVLDLVAAVRKARERVAAAAAARPQGQDSLSDAFSGIFDDIFSRGRR